jgi:hypothetical protein
MREWTIGGNAAGASLRRREETWKMPFLIEEDQATAEIRAVYEDIKKSRNTDWVNNFWKAIANHPPTLKRLWATIKEVMAPGELVPTIVDS